jgi:hypothetical protein
VLLVLYVTMLGMAVGVRDAGTSGSSRCWCWHRRSCAEDGAADPRLVLIFGV